MSTVNIAAEYERMSGKYFSEVFYEMYGLVIISCLLYVTSACTYVYVYVYEDSKLSFHKHGVAFLQKTSKYSSYVYLKSKLSFHKHVVF